MPHCSDSARAPDPSAFRLPAVNGPFVVVLDFVSNRTAEGVCAWPESKPLLDQAAGQSIEFRNTAGTQDPAAAGSAMNLDPEDYADQSADPCISQASGIVGREDITANLFELRPSAVAATAESGPNPAGPSTGPAADSRTSSRSAAGGGYRCGGRDRDDGDDCRTFARAGGSWGASQRRRSDSGSTLLLRLRLRPGDPCRDLWGWRLRLWRL